MVVLGCVPFRGCFFCYDCLLDFFKIATEYLKQMTWPLPAKKRLERLQKDKIACNKYLCLAFRSLEPKSSDNASENLDLKARRGLLNSNGAIYIRRSPLYRRSSTRRECGFSLLKSWSYQLNCRENSFIRKHSHR